MTTASPLRIAVLVNNCTPPPPYESGIKTSFIDAFSAPGTKLLGICWGHQAVCIAMGGMVRDMEGGPVGGLETVSLSAAGKAFFPYLAGKGAFTTTQLHQRQIVVPAPAFTALAEDNEAFVSFDNLMLSFQAHPEIIGEFASLVMRNGNSYVARGMSVEDVEGKIRALRGEQDGMVVLEKGLEWVRESGA